MEKSHFAINFAIFFWGLAIISWYLHITMLSIIATATSISGFIIHIRINQGNHMFKKKTAINTSSSTKEVHSHNEKSLPDQKETNATIIAKNSCFEGNILSEGPMNIFGNLKGNIEAPNGRVEIIKGGFVEGDITCRELIVNGNLTGHCISNSLEIAENGKITGTIAYGTLTIKKGGEFSGQAEALEDENNQTFDITETNTTSLISDITCISRDLI